MAGKFKKFLASLLFLTPTAALAQKTVVKTASKNKVETVSKPKVRYDRFARYREAEKEIMQQLIFFEGCATEAYDDGTGVFTIGVGSTKYADGTPVCKGDVLKSGEEIEKQIKAHLEKRVYPYLDKYITRRLPPNEMAAVVSLCYNCGAGVLGKNGKKSALAEAINQNNRRGIIRELLKKVSTRKSSFNSGLAKRRALELYCYFGKIKPEEMIVFFVGGLRGLEVNDVLRKDRNGKYTILKTDDITLKKVKNICLETPDAERARKTAWYGGDKRVYDFINLGNVPVYQAEVVHKTVPQNKTYSKITGKEIFRR